MSEDYQLHRMSAEEYNELRRQLGKLRYEASQKIGAARMKLERKCAELEEYIHKLDTGGWVDGLPPYIEDTGSL